MLHDGRQGDRERTGKFADRETFLLVQPCEQGAPGRVGKGREGTVEQGSLMVNHNVKC